MRGSEVTFKFRGISAAAYSAIQERFPTEGNRGGWDVIKGAHALLAACAIDPVMTEDQAARLVDQISNGQLDKLFSAALLATQGDSSVPFSARASELLRASA